jgi:glycine cleavage system regulatory protein
MQTPLVLTVISADKPGLVESIAQVINRHGGNWLESRMARMAGQFAGILRVDIAEQKVEPLRVDLNGLTAQGINVQVAVSAQAELPQQSVLHLNLVGNDRLGIVHEVSQVLARHGVNVEALDTGCEPAPMSSEMLFRAQATLGVYPQTDLAALRQDLENIAADLMVELSED